MLIHNPLGAEHMRRAWCWLLVKPTAMAGQREELLGCLWQDEGGQSHVGSIMSGRKDGGEGGGGEI